MAFLSADGSGRYCDVFLDGIQQLHTTRHIGFATVVGNVMAHELGHLLLGLHAHSLSGIMRAHWDETELGAASMGRLSFTREQSELMRERLAVGLASSPDSQKFARIRPGN